MHRCFVDHLVFPNHGYWEGQVLTLVLWTVLTYVYPAWPAVPYLAIGGYYGAAKSRVLEILEQLAFNAVMSVSVTPALMFRSLDSWGSTFLLDEVEALGSKSARKNDLLRILNAGYRASGVAHRIEMVDGIRQSVSYNVFSSKAIAGIGALESTLESRCIRLTMCRAKESAPESRLIINGADRRWTDVRNDLYCFALEYGTSIAEMAQCATICNYGGRDYELWQPIFVLAILFESAGVEGVVSKVRHFADSLRDEPEIGQPPRADELLLRQLALYVRLQEQRSLTPQTLLGATQPFDPALFASWTPKRVSNVLGHYGIRAVKSNGRRVYRDVTITDLENVERLYDLDLSIGSK